MHLNEFQFESKVALIYKTQEGCRGIMEIFDSQMCFGTQTIRCNTANSANERATLKTDILLIFKMN